MGKRFLLIQIKTTNMTTKVKYPAWVTLENGKQKIMHSESDANSWAKSVKSEIQKTEPFEVSEPKNYNPSNYSVKLSNRLLGGNNRDFVEGF